MKEKKNIEGKELKDKKRYKECEKMNRIIYMNSYKKKQGRLCKKNYRRN